MASRYGLEVRAATAADAPGIGELMASAGRPIDPRALAERLDALDRQHGTALVALEWGPPSGLIVLHWYRSLETAAPVAQATTLLVGPEARRRGIGRLLLKAGAQAARLAGCGAIQVQATVDQPELQAFCRAAGFADAGAGFVRPLRKKG